ncbi:hypothetical protein MML48_4g00018519 [Holotrichia oblita]|uniref:Uncharacterized protein n=2 Tax=Holotrichia oblita TaxID=644536 RepID=A0ACB9TAA5_HOLOL|nr:hypothetical protein MML48_4g00011084 [Holotrichia oblita]KAI4463766.1 hypothetical protein MML48_4g00018519 [Holotrichia oblita]
MFLLKTTAVLLKRNVLELPHLQGTNIINIEHLRCISTLPITKNLVLMSKEKKKAPIKSLKLSPDQNRPLVVMPTWLMAKEKHIKKYANFYLDYGFDVLNISVTPWQLLWPVKGTQVVAKDILKFLQINKSYSPLVVHGFSVGAYLWAEVLVRLAAERSLYQPIIDRISGQIFDSAADITELVIGVPIAVFPSNKVMQNALRSYLLYHMKKFDKVATSHYVRASQMYHTNLIRVPALIFCSEKDPIGAVRSNQRARENWESNGTKVYWKCWDDSAHVGHFQKHPKEYLDTLRNYLDKLDLLANRDKIQIKI